ncbi:MAG: hypothetical protein NC099_02920 [Corallococcus sp.]|nr:hypothetical protein [Corallococcus sp.]
MVCINSYACVSKSPRFSSPYSSSLAPQKQHLPFTHSCRTFRNSILPCISSNLLTEYLLLGYLLQYTLLRDKSDVSPVMAMAKSCLWNMWFNRSCKSGITFSSPLISRFAISRKNTPDLHAGSKNVVSGLSNNSCGNISSI